MEITNRYEGAALFLKANAAIAIFCVTLFAIGPDVRQFIRDHYWIMLAAFATCEILTLVYIKLQIDSHDLKHDDPDLHADLFRSKIDIRFATRHDFTEVIRVFHQWFTDDVSINDTDYLQIMSRKGHLRVAEVTLSNGNYVEKRIIGYYSVWPLSRQTYDKLCRGKMREMDLKHQDVLDIHDPTAEIIYVPEICVSKGCDVGPILLRDLLRYAYHLLGTKEQIQTIAAWPYTKYGKRLTRAFHMKKARGRPFFQKIVEIHRNLIESISPPKGGFKEKFTIHY